MRMKQASRVKTSRRLNKSTLMKRLGRVRRFMPFGREFDPTILLVAIGIAAAIMLRVALRSVEPGESGTAGVQQQSVPAQVLATASPAAKTAKPLPERSNVKTSVEPAAETIQASPEAIQQAPVTITGCLEQNNDAFRLKDTTGVDAPKSRSWKSGFLRKKTPTIEVVDRAHRLELPTHVGQRVVVTGTLVDREMEVRSLRRVAASCNQEA